MIAKAWEGWRGKVWLNGENVTDRCRQFCSIGPFGVVELYILDGNGNFTQKGDDVATTLRIGRVRHIVYRWPKDIAGETR